MVRTFRQILPRVRKWVSWWPQKRLYNVSLATVIGIELDSRVVGGAATERKARQAEGAGGEMAMLKILLKMRASVSGWAPQPHLMDEGLLHSLIKGYLSVVRRLQIVKGLGDPFSASWRLLVTCAKQDPKTYDQRNVCP